MRALVLPLTPEVETEDVDDELLDRFIAATDELSNVSYAFQMKRRQREKPVSRSIRLWLLLTIDQKPFFSRSIISTNIFIRSAKL